MATTPTDAARIDALEAAVFGTDNHGQAESDQAAALNYADRHTRAQLDAMAADAGLDTSGEPNKLAAATALVSALVSA